MIEIIQPIEDNLFVKSEEQIFLYTYRSFAVALLENKKLLICKNTYLIRNHHY